ncbi:MAG TPA: ABC transporter ATP-binding protein [Methylomirabilota bacterium]|nr:ABC transporter ATP-binding protein [Methylomirabilota bacterium]
MALLQTHGLTKRFGGLLAVDHVDLEIDSGEAVGIVGPNGSGKSTLFNLITGVHYPDEGKVFFDGREITQLAAHERAHLGIGRTFQIPRPFGSLTVRENVAIGAMFGTKEGQRDVEEALQFADEQLKRIGFYERRERRGRELTPTEMKMMEIARALAMRPRLLLLDEAMAGMPPKDIDALVELLKSIKQKEQIAVIAMVEHIMRAVVSFAEKVIVLYQGKKMIEAPPEQALSDPRVVDVYLGRESTE